MDIDARDSGGSTALDKASQYGHDEVGELLISEMARREWGVPFIDRLENDNELG